MIWPDIIVRKKPRSKKTNENSFYSLPKRCKKLASYIPLSQHTVNCLALPGSGAGECYDPLPIVFQRSSFSLNLTGQILKLIFFCSDTSLPPLNYSFLNRNSRYQTLDSFHLLALTLFLWFFCSHTSNIKEEIHAQKALLE